MYYDQNGLTHKGIDFAEVKKNKFIMILFTF